MYYVRFKKKKKRFCSSPSSASIALQLAMTVVPDQEAGDNNDDSTRNKSHQQSGHINPASFVLFCGKLTIAVSN